MMKKLFMLAMSLFFMTSACLVAANIEQDKNLMKQLKEFTTMPKKKQGTIKYKQAVKQVFDSAVAAIKNGANPNLALEQSPYKGWTLLHFAADHENVEVVKFLLGRPGIKIKAITASNRRPWYIADTHGNEVIKNLIQDVAKGDCESKPTSEFKQREETIEQESVQRPVKPPRQEPSREGNTEEIPIIFDPSKAVVMQRKGLQKAIVSKEIQEVFKEKLEERAASTEQAGFNESLNLDSEQDSDVAYISKLGQGLVIIADEEEYSTFDSISVV